MLDPVHHMLDGVHHMMDRRAIIWWTPSKIWWMGSIIWWIPFFVKFAKPLVFSSPRIKEFIFKFYCEILFLISNFVAELFILIWIWMIWGPSYNGPCPSYNGPPVHHIMDPIHHIMVPVQHMMESRVAKNIASCILTAGQLLPKSYLTDGFTWMTIWIWVQYVHILSI